MPPLAPTDKADDAAEMYVAAGEPVSFSQMEDFGPSRCLLKPVTFIPEANKDYEIRYLYDYFARRCGATVVSLSDGKKLDNIFGTACGIW
jgi:hypothetical protein